MYGGRVHRYQTGDIIMMCAKQKSALQLHWSRKQVWKEVMINGFKWTPFVWTL